MSDMFGHHEAPFNGEKIFYNLKLMEDHYSLDPCANCCVKHLSTIIAYAEEGRSLNNATVKWLALFDRAEDLANRHLKIVIGCAVDNVCKVKDQNDMLKMIQEARSLRRDFGMELYGIDTDVVHDFTEGHVHHSHEHELGDHTKALGIDIHDDTAVDTGDDISEHITLNEHISV